MKPGETVQNNKDDQEMSSAIVPRINVYHTGGWTVICIDGLVLDDARLSDLASVWNDRSRVVSHPFALELIEPVPSGARGMGADTCTKPACAISE